MANRFKAPRPGTCRICGCTEDRACVGGCEWVDRACTICSTCAGTPQDLALALRWVATLLNERGRSCAPTDHVRSARVIAIEAFKRAAAREIDTAWLLAALADIKMLAGRGGPASKIEALNRIERRAHRALHGRLR